jgi:hypothetical protein
MGRDTWRYRAQERERTKKKRMNPIWRGVGCLTIVFLTLAGYGFADWFLRANATSGWVNIPRVFLVLPIAPWLPYGILVKIVVAILFMLMSYGLVSTVYAILFPIRPEETDAPPIRRGSQRRGL